jgi:hypothetical protein
MKVASALSPRDARWLLALGLRAEMRGDMAAAEHYLLQAARVNKRFEPRWTLAGFYYRAGKDDFWHWTRSALDISFADARPVFDLCWRRSPAPSTILQRAIPDRAEVLSQYARFLLDKREMSGAGACIVRLLNLGAYPREAPLAYIDAAIAGSDVASAADIWNRMIAQGKLPYGPLGSRDGEVVTNGDFLHAPLQAGFDWRVSPSSGVNVLFAPRQCRITLSGKQPESLEVMNQAVLLPADGGYELAYDFETRGIAPDSGLRWSLNDARDGSDVAPASAHLSSEVPSTARIRFSPEPRLRQARLVLRYQRPAGMTRIEGTIMLRRVSLRRVQ